ncbi:PKD domain-containing protein [Aquabacterium humicola]|uniref:PKD domain-containing protein n=1 Tax=Aquabacterium humicola TaxID=3237377 RepID=UPI0025438902|nr:PKD domain-containing protein [Rubrivivax pictus]
MTNRRMRLVAAAWTMALVAACGGGGAGGESPTPPPPPPPAPAPVPAPTPLPAQITIDGPRDAPSQASLSWRVRDLAAAPDLRYEWTFGDGERSDVAQPAHAWSADGVYELRVTVRNGAGATIAATADVYIGRHAAVAGAECRGSAPGSGWCWTLPQPRPRPIAEGVLAGDVGILVGEAGALWVSGDGGANWARQPAPVDGDLLHVVLGEGRDAWAIARSGQVLYSDDGGRQWQRVGQVPSGVTDLSHGGAGRLAAQLAGQNALVSEDGGRSWRDSGLRGLLAFTRAGTMIGWRPDGRSIAVLRDTGRGSAATIPCDSTAEWPRICEPVAVGGDDATELVVITREKGEDGGPLPPWTRHSSRDGGRQWIAETMAAPFVTWDVARLGADGQGWNRELRHNEYVQLWRTADGGRTWSQATANWPATDLVVYWPAVDSRSAIVRDSRGFVLTTDGGRTWRVIPRLRDVDVWHSAGGRLLVKERTTQNEEPFERWLSSADGGNNWTELPPTRLPPTSSSWAFGPWFMPDGTRGFAVRWDHDWDVTEDGGVHWTRRRIADNARFTVQQVTADGTVWAIVPGAMPSIARSQDMGLTWERIDLAPASGGRETIIDKLLFVDARDGWIQMRDCMYGLCSSSLMKTQDGGRTLSSLGSFQQVFYRNGATGIARDLGGLYRTQDHGATWQKLPFDEPYVRAFFSSASEGWLYVRNGMVRRTSDGGTTWQPVDAQGGNDLWFADAMHGWIVGDGGRVMATTDGGRTWTRQESGTERDLERVRGASANLVWLIGRDFVLTTATGGREGP